VERLSLLTAGIAADNVKDARIMNPGMETYEKLGQFYLGREMEPGSEKPDGGLLLYDSKDLVTHGVVLGMTGSGKTGLCLALLEEAAMDNIPAIIIDPKGDIANLLLAFPDLAPADFLPWVNEDDAARKGITVEGSAEKTAALWKSGLAEWGQSAERVRQFREKVDINVFTPGSSAGIPVSILGSLEAPPFAIVDDAEAFTEQIVNTVASLLALVGGKEGVAESAEAVLLSTIFQNAWRAGENLTLESLIRHIQSPTFDKVGVMDLETFLSAKARMELALKFNSLVASPGFAAWLQGVPLDIAHMLHDPSGKPRISIFSIAHLNDADRMFFVSLLLNQMLGWVRQQKGTTSLRALLYMDEIFGYLPPSANPPSKRPLMTLLKQSRAFGVGCLLATQNPVDLDYKALSNIGTWFLGRLQTERDKARVLDGLEGAAGSRGGGFDRSSIERLLSGLGNRIFLMNNVHEDAPVLFHVRWVMSYLAGPLTRSQIKLLMDPKRSLWLEAKQTCSENPMAMAVTKPSNARPSVGTGVVERFIESSGVEGMVYRPYLMRLGTVHFSSAKMGIDASRVVRTAHPIKETGIDWENPADVCDRTSKVPMEGGSFAELPGFAMNAANYREVEKEFLEWLYRNERADVYWCPKLKKWSAWGESEGAFRTRLTHEAHEARDLEMDKLRVSTAKKIQTWQDRLRTAEAQLDRQKTEANAAKMQAGVSILGGILGGLFGRKAGMGTVTRATSAVGRASSAYKQQQDVSAADAKVKTVMEQIAALEAESEVAMAQIAADYETSALVIETQVIKPSRTDVKVNEVSLTWVPFTQQGEPGW
jgi:hypothetical protein